MPSYAKFLKDIMSKKKRLRDHEIITFIEGCSAILDRKLPQKLKDLGSFDIPCTIGNIRFGKALYDLGSSINLMPLSIFKRLRVGKAKPNSVTLQMVYKSIKRPRGVVEDLLVKVDKFIFLADFIVLNMEENYDIPIILGCPFLATRRHSLMYKKGELTMRV